MTGAHQRHRVLTQRGVVDGSAHPWTKPATTGVARGRNTAGVDVGLGRHRRGRREHRVDRSGRNAARAQLTAPTRSSDTTGLQPPQQRLGEPGVVDEARAGLIDDIMQRGSVYGR